ncbi:MAG TPA: hypothetical protein VFR86_28250 [Burkholderiaceae bacterium]|nr:hypothetical protein [Burkholderiaceae bacterium]
MQQALKVAVAKLLDQHRNIDAHATDGGVRVHPLRQPLGARERILAADFDGYVSKPFEIRELLVAVKSALSGG